MIHSKNNFSAGLPTLRATVNGIHTTQYSTQALTKIISVNLRPNDSNYTQSVVIRSKSLTEIQVRVIAKGKEKRKLT